MSSDAQSAAQVGSLGKKIVKAMLVITFFWVFWKFGGFLMNLFIARYWNATREADAYFFVSKYLLYTLVYSTTLKVLMPAFMPVFMEEMEEKGEEKAWNFVSAVLNLLLVGGVVVILVGFLLAPRIASFAEGFDAQGQAIATHLLRWMLPGALGMILGVLLYALLNSYKIFNYPAAGDAAQKLVWVAVLFVTFKLLGFAAVAVGFLFGCAVQLLVNAWGLRTKWRMVRPRLGLSGRRFVVEGLWLGLALALMAGWYWLVRSAASYMLLMLTGATVVCCLYLVWLEWRAKRRGTAMGKLAALSAPLFIGVLFARYRDFATVFFQSYTSTGVFSDIEYARSVGQLPTILIATALSFAMFPYLCELAMKKDLDTYAALMTRTLRLIALFFVPLTVVMIVLDEPIMQLIIDRGQFPLIHLHYAGKALSLFVFALFFIAIENVLMQYFFSMQQMWWPTALGVISAIFQTLFLWLGINAFGYNYPYEIFVLVAIALATSRIFKNVFLLAVMRARMPIFPPRETLVFVAQLAVICVAVGGVVHGSFQPLQRLLPVNHLKEREVLVDTFNYEPRGWFSLDADELDVLPGARSLRLSGEPDKELTVSCSDLPREQLLRVARLRLWVRADGPAQVAARLQARDGTVFAQEVALEQGGEWECLELPLADFQPEGDTPTSPNPSFARRGAANRRLRVANVTGLSLAVTLDSPRSAVWVDAVAFVAKSGQVIVVDDFETKTVPWTPASEAVVCSVEPNTTPPLMKGGPGGVKRGAHALWAHYRRSARRRISLRRDLTDFRLEGATELRFVAKAAQPGVWSVQLAGPQGTQMARTVSIKEAKTWLTCTLDLPGDAASQRLEALILEDVTKTPAGRPTPTQLWVDDLRFVREDGTELVIDDFEQERQGWINAVGSPTVADTGEGDTRAELALLLSPGVQQVQRDLRGYRLDGTSAFRCKMKAEQSEKVTLLLETSDGGRWQRTLDVEPSEKRKSHEVPLADFQSLGGPELPIPARSAPFQAKSKFQREALHSRRSLLDPARIERLVVTREYKVAGKLWLDNVAFKSKTPVKTYEMRKLVLVGVPVLLGTLVFIVLIFVLRVEEAGMIATWLRTEGLAKIKAKLSGRGKRDEGRTTGDE